MRTAASKYRRSKEEMTPAPIHRKWGRVWDASARTGLSKSEIYKVINDPESEVESFIYKGQPGHKSGCRMINLESLDKYLDRMMAATKATQSTTAS